MSISHLNLRVPVVTSAALSDARVSLSNRLRASFAEFYRWSWPIIEPSTPLVWSWHLEVLCDALSAISRGETKRLIVNIPPGTGKSITLALWNAWEWTTSPYLRYFTASYTDVNTIRDNLRVRKLIQSPKYEELFTDDDGQPLVVLSRGQAEKVNFENTATGYRIASSVGGYGTGSHPHRIVIDDPHKVGEIPSFTARESVHTWFKGTISTRVALDPAIVAIMQRLHDDDFSGRQLAKLGRWEHICLPMEYEPSGVWDCSCHKRPDPRDRRTSPNELLFPTLFNREKVTTLIDEIGGELFAAGQLQQRPRPITGGMFKREMFKFIDRVDIPADVIWCRGWDAAATQDGGDWSVGVKMGKAGAMYIVDHECRVQVENNDPYIKAMAKRDGVYCAVREEQEPGSSGKKVISYHATLLAGYDYAGVTISGSKITRAKPFRSQCGAGNVYLVRGDWNEDYIEELCSFPVGKHDDRVDASSCAFNYLALEGDDETEEYGAVL